MEKEKLVQLYPFVLSSGHLDFLKLSENIIQAKIPLHTEITTNPKP